MEHIILQIMMDESLPTRVTKIDIVRKTITVDSSSSFVSLSGSTYSFQKLPYIIVDSESGINAPTGTEYKFSRLSNNLNYYKSRDLHPDHMHMKM